MQKYNQFPRQGNNFQTFVPDAARTFEVFLSVTTDNIVASRILVHHIQKRLFNARTFLVDGIIKRVYQMVNALNNLVPIQTFGRSRILLC